ncbi:MAG: saccharopine dehydrogenase NADP-binding domain-containing protein [Melioribacteraceae bacterium]|nr:saccharopine dehydrogenase NADP-binding domain-containing protein [Melioribacteraceae bacterium]
MNSFQNSLMVYGANGYSAQLIIEELLSRGIKPILAGRNGTAIKKIAQKYSCVYKIFDLTDDKKSIESLTGIHTVVNCAGPFKYTAKEMIDYCLHAKTNYLDITGEMPALAYAFGCDKKAKENGIVILPSVGFDIIPTDCLAKRLSEQMPDAKYLKLGFSNKKGGISRGTSLTTLEFISGKGKIRKNGQLVDSPIGKYSIKVKTNGVSFYGISIPWGDVFTSYFSTGIPNVEVYMGLSKPLFIIRKLLTLLLKIYKLSFIKKISANYISREFTGPDKVQRDSTLTYVWGKVENEKGEMVEELYRVMEGYNLTAKGAAEAAIRVLKNEVKPGTYTPSLAFGSNFLELFVVKRLS